MTARGLILSGCIVGLCLLLAALRVAAESAPSPAGAAAPQQRSKPLQSVRGDHVKIEGKLYSPQALFVMTRREEPFSRDAVVPHYLAAPGGAAFLPYRLRTAAVPAAAAVQAPAVPAAPRP